MATQNLFELLGDEESDAAAVIERAAATKKMKQQEQQQQQQKQQQKPQQQQAPAKLPSKPLPPSEAVKESKPSQYSGGRGRGDRSRGRGIRDRDREGAYNPPGHVGGFQRDREGYNRDVNGLQRGRGPYYSRGSASQRGGAFSLEVRESGQMFEGGRGRGRGRGEDRSYGEGGHNRGNFTGYQEQQGRREFERGIDSGQGKGDKRESDGGANWGAQSEQSTEEAAGVVDKQPAEETKAEPEIAEVKKEEDKEMLLDDYYKALEEKRNHLRSTRLEERKVVVDKAFERMMLVEKKHDESSFIKLGSEKDKGKKKEIPDKEDKTRKSVSINEFLRPTEGEAYYTPASRRGRGRGRGDHGGFRGGFGGNPAQQSLAPRIEDPGHFPTLGAK